ncbi:hypothetical protein LZ30DRAFT_303242 [Colletotrichum cereale]|nr:hypothetical protein LZ30DRAFT_303242 [Colletotrichum cereale]
MPSTSLVPCHPLLPIIGHYPEAPPCPALSHLPSLLPCSSLVCTAAGSPIPSVSRERERARRGFVASPFASLESSTPTKQGPPPPLPNKHGPSPVHDLPMPLVVAQRSIVHALCQAASPAPTPARRLRGGQTKSLYRVAAGSTIYKTIAKSLRSAVACPFPLPILLPPPSPNVSVARHSKTLSCFVLFGR